MYFRLIGVLIAVALAASACGGGDAATTERVEELQDRIAELNGDTDPDAELTDAERIEELQARTEELNGDSDAASPSNDEPETSSPSTQSSGVNGELGPDDFVQVAIDTVGPTDDLTGTIRNLDATFIELTTPPDANISGTTSTIRNVPLTGLTRTTILVYQTSADLETTVYSLGEDLTAAFQPAPIERNDVPDAGTGSAVQLVVEDYQVNVISDEDGQVGVLITRTVTNDVGPDEVSLFDGVTGTLTPPPGAVLDIAEVSTFIGPPQLNVRWFYPGLTRDQQSELVDPVLEQLPLGQVSGEIDVSAYSTDAKPIDRGHEDGMFLDIFYNY